ncbi:hypothetical protein [Tuwongella immobilis]|uniref:Uncharacterized protein n=1 Tax=Tuwongella immobilis TaxID=692036 RepID=A0A6C2YSV4_9BACT|nr:hypothetical protein [Tuwongella immobilis]VIP03962.1 unnamed protein product [Tuwongella immobilis]VTS05291.1 unnamed protein product [Tuwongella immobilis]
MSNPQITSSRTGEQPSRELMDSLIKQMELEIDRAFRGGKKVDFHVVRPAKPATNQGGFAVSLPGSETTLFIFQIGDAKIDLGEMIRNIAAGAVAQ